MAAAGEVLRRNLPVNLGSCVGSCKASPELHVLAVDDSLVDRKVIEKLLKSFSCKVTAVESGRRALQFLGLEGDKASSVGLKVNLIMTDYSMPGMTGYELLKKIKGSSDFRDVPVVIMSSETILARINRCLEEGAEEFLEKPVKLSDIERLTKILAREEPEDDSEEDNSSTRKRKRKRKRKLQTETDDDSDHPKDQSLAPESPLSNRRASDSPKRLRRV